LQASRSTISTWRSPTFACAGAPSTGTFFGIGYGPWSLSSAYSKLTWDFGVEAACTVTVGIPIRDPS